MGNVSAWLIPIVTVIGGGCGWLATWLYKIWEKRHQLDSEETKQRFELNQQKRNNIISGYEKLNQDLQTNIKELHEDFDKYRDRSENQIALILRKNVDLQILCESLRGELRMCQFYITQLRVGVPSINIEEKMTVVIYIDQDGTILEIQPTVTMLFHWFAREVMGQNIKILIPERYHKMHEEGLKSAVENGGKIKIRKTLALTGLKRGREEIDINVKISDGWVIGDKIIFGALIWARNGNVDKPGDLDQVFVASDPEIPVIK